MTDILAIGGLADAITGTIDRYDVRGDRWTHAGDLSCRRDMAAAVIVDGRIYVCGGRNADLEDENATEQGDLQAKEWVDAAWLKDPRRNHGAAALGGLVYVLGGFWGSDRLSSIHCFDPRDGRWSRCGDMPVALGPATASVIDERLWVVGEVTPHRWEAWSGVPPGPWAREGAFDLDRRWPAVCAHDRSFFLCGGMVERTPSARVDRFDLAGGELVSLPDMPTARVLAGAASAGDRILVAGGHGADDPHGSVATESFHPRASTWQRLAPLPYGRSGLCALAVESD